MATYPSVKTQTPRPLNQGTRDDVSVDRTSFAAGWYITKNVMFKAEYVTQNYKGYPEETSKAVASSTDL